MRMQVDTSYLNLACCLRRRSTHIGATCGTRPFPHYFAAMRAGKDESIVANMQTDAGEALLHELIAGADVLVGIYRTEVMDRLGLASRTGGAPHSVPIYYHVFHQRVWTERSVCDASSHGYRRPSPLRPDLVFGIPKDDPTATVATRRTWSQACTKRSGSSWRSTPATAVAKGDTSIYING
jgi:hypothetical protein